MPDEPRRPPLDGQKQTRSSVPHKFQHLDRISDPFVPITKLLPTVLPSVPGGPPSPRRMYHPSGRFREQSGSTFDYLFAELLEDRSIALPAFLGVPTLLRGTTDLFFSRRSAREEDRLSIGLKYGHGDLPDRSAASRL